jgi:hypothetical protein
MEVLLTLNTPAGADLGPFNLTANVGSVVPSTGTRVELLAGLTVAVDDSATSITITSTGNCTNNISVLIQNRPTASYCYEVVGVQSAPGECFDCPGFFASSTDYVITFYDDCNGNEIPAPADINISVTYTDSSTSGSFIPSGTTGPVLIAYSDIQCVPAPTCGETASPDLQSTQVTTTTGVIIPYCCI